MSSEFFSFFEAQRDAVATPEQRQGSDHLPKLTTLSRLCSPAMDPNYPHYNNPIYGAPQDQQVNSA